MSKELETGNLVEEIGKLGVELDGKLGLGIGEWKEKKEEEKGWE